MKNKKSLILFVSLSLTLLNCNKLPAKLEVIESVNYNFGVIFVGDTVKHNFVIKNAGNITLNVTKIIPSCSCTIPHIQMKDIEPNATSKIQVDFIPRVEDIGFIDKEIAIRTNAEPKITILHIKGKVLPK